MTQITIAAEVFRNVHLPAGAGYLRLFANQSFYTNDGKPVTFGAPDGDSDAAYQEIVGASDGTDFSLPSFVIDSTTDSDTPEATYSAYLYDGKRANRILIDPTVFRVQITALGSLLWNDLKQYNNGRRAQVTPDFPNFDQLYSIPGFAAARFRAARRDDDGQRQNQAVLSAR